MKTYFYKGANYFPLKRYDNLIGRILLPKGNYTIQAKALVASTTSRWNYTEIFNAKLECGNQHDEALMSVYPRLDTSYHYGENINSRPPWVDKYEEHGGRETIVFLQIAVKLEQPTNVNFKIFNASSGEKSTQLASGISILAREEDLTILDTFEPDSHFEPGHIFTKVSINPDLLEFLKKSK